MMQVWSYSQIWNKLWLNFTALCIWSWGKYYYRFTFTELKNPTRPPVETNVPKFLLDVTLHLKRWFFTKNRPIHFHITGVSLLGGDGGSPPHQLKICSSPTTHLKKFSPPVDSSLPNFYSNFYFFIFILFFIPPPCTK